MRAERPLAIGGGVAIAKQQDIDLDRRIAVLLDLDGLLPGSRRSIDERIGRIDRVTPDLLVFAFGIALLQDDDCLARQRRKAERVAERPTQLLGFGGRSHSANAGS